MNIGMLWFDNDPKRTLQQKIERAAEHYRRKYGQTANVVFLHPATPRMPAEIGGLAVKTSKTVLPNHFWLGVKD